MKSKCPETIMKKKSLIKIINLVKSSELVILPYTETYNGTKCCASQDHGATHVNIYEQMWVYTYDIKVFKHIH